MSIRDHNICNVPLAAIAMCAIAAPLAAWEGIMREKDSGGVDRSTEFEHPEYDNSSPFDECVWHHYLDPFNPSIDDVSKHKSSIVWGAETASAYHGLGLFDKRGVRIRLGAQWGQIFAYGKAIDNWNRSEDAETLYTFQYMRLELTSESGCHGHVDVELAPSFAVRTEVIEHDEDEGVHLRGHVYETSNVTEVGGAGPTTAIIEAKVELDVDTVVTGQYELGIGVAYKGATLGLTKVTKTFALSGPTVNQRAFAHPIELGTEERFDGTVWFQNTAEVNSIWADGSHTWIIPYPPIMSMSLVQGMIFDSRAHAILRGWCDDHPNPEVDCSGWSTLEASPTN
jgi:hypothetical protein